jgi:hypothetical protein
MPVGRRLGAFTSTPNTFVDVDRSQPPLPPLSTGMHKTNRQMIQVSVGVSSTDFHTKLDNFGVERLFTAFVLACMQLDHQQPPIKFSHGANLMKINQPPPITH